MSDPIVRKSDGEFPTPTAPQEMSRGTRVDEHGHPLADVEFPMPGVETVYNEPDADPEAKTVAKADTKVVDKGSASTKAK